MNTTAEIRPGAIIGVHDGNVYSIVGPGENSPPGQNLEPSATTIECADNILFHIEVTDHTDSSAIIFLNQVQDESLVIDFRNQRLARGEELTVDGLTIYHAI